MANYYGTTVSEGGKIKDKEAINKLLEGYYWQGNEGEISIETDGEEIIIYGYDSFCVYEMMKDGDTGDDIPNYDEDCTEKFLTELAKYIETPLVIKEVGNEKCRYVNAEAWIVEPDSKPVYVNLDDAINSKLN